MFRRSLKFAVVTMLVASAASAQDFSSYGDMGMSMGSATLDTVINDVTLNPNLPDRVRRGERRGEMRAPLRVEGAAVRLGYTPTRAVKERALAGYVARIARKDPAASRTVAQEFARHDAGSIYRGIAGSFGMRDNDIADILTSYTVLGYLVATGAPDPSPGSVVAARNQIAAGLAQNPKFADPRLRADLGEELKLLFVTVHAGWQAARREGNLKQYGDGIAAQWRRQSGKDLRALRLTSQGFSPR